MAKFQPREIILSEINLGNRYATGDIVTSEAINSPIEASAYAQKISQAAMSIADEAMSKINDTELGSITLSAYPIGSIFMTTKETEPAVLFGGSWARIKDTFILASGDKHDVIGETGGDETHTLTVDEMPSHTHQVAWCDNDEIKNGNIFSSPSAAYTSYIGWRDEDYKRYGVGEVETKGGGQSFDIMPPYIVVNVWERKA